MIRRGFPVSRLTRYLTHTHRHSTTARSKYTRNRDSAIRCLRWHIDEQQRVSEVDDHIFVYGLYGQTQRGSVENADGGYECNYNEQRDRKVARTTRTRPM